MLRFKPFLTLLILLIQFMFTISGYGQDLKKIVPLTPNAAALGKYGDVPVGLYTGQLNLSIPMYEIVLNDFTLPISLSYNSSGLKVEETPSWVGLGWALNANGVINRQLRGLPDESEFGYNGLRKSGLTAAPLAVKFMKGETSFSEVEKAFLKNLIGNNTDSEPDMFVFNCVGNSGKFFFDESQCNIEQSKVPILIPRQPLGVSAKFNYSRIQNIKRGAIDKFTIIDGKGIQYHFEVLELPTAELEKGDPDRENFVNSWYLSKIVTPNGNQITFTYELRQLALPPTVHEARDIQMQFNNGIYDNLNKYNKSTFYSTTQEAILKEITWKGGKVKFIEGAERNDWSFINPKGGEKARFLAEVQVLQTNGTSEKLIKKINLNYNNGTDRLMLNSVQESKGTEKKEPYTFSYYTGTMPLLGNQDPFYQDHWGYYNGRTNSTLLPTYYGIGTNVVTGASIYINVQGGNRSANWGAARAGMLQSVTYPTKGTSSFEYESHDYLAPVTQNLDACGGEFEVLASLQATGTQSLTYDFTSSGECLQIDYEMFVSCFDGEAYVYIDNTTTFYKHITIKEYNAKCGGKTNCTLSKAETGVNLFIGSGAHKLIVEFYGEGLSACNNTSTRPNRAKMTVRRKKPLDSTPQLANFEAGGLRVAKTIDCPSDGGNCVTKTYQYRDNIETERSSGVLVSQPVYEANRKVLVNNDGGTTLYEEVDVVTLTATSSVPIATSQGSHLSYHTVTVLEGLDDSKGKTVHRFTTAKDFPDQGIKEFPFPPLASMDWQRGNNISTKQIKKAATNNFLPLQETTSFYTSPSTLSYNRIIAFKPGVAKENQVGEMFPNPAWLYHIFKPYSLVSGWQYLESKTQKETFYQADVAIGSIENTQSFLYENSSHLQPTQTITINSQGQTIKNILRYKGDVANITNLTPAEISGISTMPSRIDPIETQQFKNDKLISTTRTTYSNKLPDKIQTAQGNYPLETRILFQRYDASGNLLQQAKANNISSAYIWSYDATLPIAEVINATTDKIAYSSFEFGTSEGGWIYTKVPVVATPLNLSKTGGKHYVISATTDNLTKSMPAGTYLLSYWAKNGTINVSGGTVTDQAAPSVADGSGWVLYQKKLVLSATTTVTVSGSGALDELRLYPLDAQMTTYTHDPLIGMTSSTDAANVTTYYEYDELQRLKRIKDQDNNIIKHNVYHYKGQ